MTEPHVPTEPHAHGSNPLSALTRKVGPLPGWVWVALVVGGAYLYRRLRPSAPAVAASSPTADSASTDSPTGSVMGSIPSSSAPAPDNATWAANAANGLIASGHNPSQVESALAAYLNGQPLDANSRSLVDAALGQYKTPPQGVLPVRMAPAPPKAATPASHPAPHPGTVKKPAAPAKKPAPKPGPRVYFVKPGDTLSAISQHYYGSAGSYMKIASANGITNPDHITPGQRLVIPT